MNVNRLFVLSFLLFVYYSLKFYIPYGNYIIHPINLFVTFLHEFGHSLFVILTGGSVLSVQINTDGSGYATTIGGIPLLVLLGGYIGSSIFGNILLYIGAKKELYSQKMIYFLSFLMIFTGIFWFNSITSTTILFILALLLYLLSKKSKYNSIILQFLGISSLFYIIEDFRGGPTSDIAKFSQIFIILPQIIWMYIWLILVLILTGYNLHKILKN